MGLATEHATGSPPTKAKDTPLAAHTDNDRIGTIKRDEPIESCCHTTCDKFKNDRNLGKLIGREATKMKRVMDTLRSGSYSTHFS